MSIHAATHRPVADAESPVPRDFEKTTSNARSPLLPQAIDDLKVITRRGSLPRTRRAVAKGGLTVGFLGGSITEGWEGNWPGPVAAWFAETFPSTAISVENAAIGATGSDSACLRVDHEIIGRGCNLVFVEYVVNDSEQTTQRRGRAREGLLRKLLAAGCDVVLVYTYRQNFYAEMMQGKTPASVAEFEQLGERYGLSSVWVGLHALNEVRAGHMKWEEWLPDGLHPSVRGSWSYAAAVVDFLGGELKGPTHDDADAPGARALPAPLHPLHWESLRIVPLTDARGAGPWLLKRLHNNYHVEQVLETHSPGARLSFDFEGRGLAFICDDGKRAAEFQYRIDAGPWVVVTRDRPAWCGQRGLVGALLIADDLPDTAHHFELEVMHGDRPECAGTEFRLAVIGVL